MTLEVFSTFRGSIVGRRLSLGRPDMKSGSSPSSDKRCVSFLTLIFIMCKVYDD